MQLLIHPVLISHRTSLPSSQRWGGGGIRQSPEDEQSGTQCFLINSGEVRGHTVPVVYRRGLRMQMRLALCFHNDWEFSWIGRQGQEPKFFFFSLVLESHLGLVHASQVLYYWETQFQDQCSQCKIGSFPLPRMVDKNSALDQLGRVRILVLLAGYVTVGRLLCSSKPIL